MFSIIQHRGLFLIVSSTLVVIGIVSFFTWGLRLGIDFTGGTILQYDNIDDAGMTVLRQTLEADGYAPVLQRTGERGVSLRLPELTPDEHTTLTATVLEALPEAQEESFETIGPTVGRELREKAIIAIGLVLTGIILYVTWAFRRVSVGPVNSWVYGVATIIALFHDLVIVVGVFVMLGRYANVEVDSLFVTALLTVLGFSVHDTIVVFDRVRERLHISEGKRFEDIVNDSVNQTFIRSLNTSVTTVLVLAALWMFGGDTIHWFTLALIVGIVAGTYSSIFLASPLLVVWQRFRNR